MAASGLTGAARYVAVALPLPTADPFVYLVPPQLAERAVPGARVVVPLKRRELVGIVVARDAAAPPATPRPVLAVPDLEPVLTGALLRLADWMAGYYGVPLGLVLRSILPGVLWGRSQLLVRAVEGASWPGERRAATLRHLLTRRGVVTAATLRRTFGRVPYDLLEHLVGAGAVSLAVERPRVVRGARTERVVRLVGDPLTLMERHVRFRRAPARRRAYEVLEALGGAAAARQLARDHDLRRGVIAGLVADGLARLDRVPVNHDPFAGVGVTPPLEPTPQQRAALTTLAGTPRERVTLLHGVTGSGKTLVYLELLRREVTAGRGAVVLVPEIALTPQTVARVRGVFGDLVAVLHSGLSDAERAEAWWRLRRGERLVAIGARSAIFAPIPQLGAIVLDEEHEATYKQGEAPRYHARDVARVRARLEGARLVLGSATPSLESWASAQAGEALRLTLPDRVGARPLPPVELVDLRTAPLAVRTPVAWSVALDDAVRAALARGEQVLLLLNRRGFAAFLQCGSCGTASECPNCSIALTVHHAPPRLRCHYCSHQEPLAEACPRCDGAVQRMRSPGTQQLERFVTERFPDARLARMDLDVTATRWAHRRILDRVARGEVDVLLGTQMIAKGLDFPGVTLVGVVEADVALHLPDFRAAERTFQLVAQVAGRAGRGARGGRVVVQTRSPEHAALQHAAAHDVEGFLRQEFAARRVPPYPPHVSLLRILVEGELSDAAAEAAARVGRWLVALDHRLLGDRLEILGPAPAPLERVRGRWRWHLIVKAQDSRAVGHVVRAWRRQPVRFGGRGLQIALDRDPVTLL